MSCSVIISVSITKYKFSSTLSIALNISRHDTIISKDFSLICVM